MKIKRLKTINFRNLKNKDAYEFNSNFVVIYGPNEAGKTSILEAIVVGFFEKVDRHRTPDFKTWGKEDRPVIELTLEIDEKNIVIERNYQDGRNYMKGDGVDLQNEKKIRKRIEGLLGFNDPDTFRNLLTIKQNEMANIDTDGIQREIDTMVTGGVEGLSVMEILNLLDSKLSKERDRFKGEDGKVYDKICRELDALKEKRDGLKRDIEITESKRQQFEEINNALEVDEKSIESLQLITKWLDSFIPYREAGEKIDAVRDIEARMKVLEEDIKDTEGSVKDREERLKRYRGFKEKKKTLEEKEKELRATQKRYEEIIEKIKDISGIDSFLRNKEIPSKGDIERFKQLITQNKQMESTLESQAVSIDLEALSDIEIGFSGTTRRLSSSERQQLDIKEPLKKISIRDVANITIKNNGILIASENLNKCREQMKEIVERFGISTVDELEQRYEKKLERDQASKERDKLLEGKTVEEIKNTLDSLHSDVENIKRDTESSAEALGDVKSLEVEEFVLEEDKKRLSDKKKDLEELKIKKAKLLGQDTEEDLKRTKISQELNLAKIEVSDNEKDALMGLSIADLKKKREALSKEIENLMKRIQSNREKRVALEIELKHIPSYEELLKTEEDIGEKEEIKEKSYILLKALAVLEENLKSASEMTRDFIQTRINDLTSKYFHDLTRGKYDKVLVSMDNEVPIKVKEAGSHEFRDAVNRSLSTGAMQQLYFAIRLALMGILTGDKRLPLLLDDPFVDFDIERRKGAIEILSRLSALGYQCLLFTCHDFILQDLPEGCQVIKI